MDTGEPISGMAPREVVELKSQQDEGVTTVETIATPKAEPTPEIEQIKKELTDPRIISKKIDPEGRSETARAILEARASARTTKENIAGNEQKVQEIAELTSTLYQQERQKMGELIQRLVTLVVKLKNAVGLGDKQAAALQDEIDAIISERDTLYAQSYEIEDELKALKGKQADIPNPKQLLEAYYEKVATQPLSNEQKRDLLKPEVLASLSTEEYIALWRRLNPYFLAHVTCQGFRDHTGGDVMVNHTGGYHEFINGFADVMENGRSIFPPIARIGLVNRDEATLKSFMSHFLSEATSADQAKEMFLIFLNRHLASAPKYPDITATHLAAQMVSDWYYGGERGNEVFFVYPSDVLASQYAFAFNGWEKDFTRPQSETKWNDVFIWTDPNHPGVPVDSGIVFLAENTPVDPETGSKYASEIKVVDGQEKRVMIEDTALISSFVEWGKKLDDQSPLKKMFMAYVKEGRYDTKQGLEKECFATFTHELEVLGFGDTSAALASNLIGRMFGRESFDEELLQGIVRGSDAHWKRAKNTIPAKEYWENFFSKNPHLRPKHVQYYDGDPTTAVLEFQQKNNIGRADTSKTDGKLLGFDDNHVLDMEKDPRTNAGYNDLVAMADKIIEDHYGAK